MMKVAEFIVNQLSEWGVKRVYGVTGDALFPLIEALGKQSDIEFVLTAHESAAGMMASAEAKLTGKPGVCVATSGPGVANLLNGLADAAEDRVPVLAITGQVPSDKIGTGYKQYIDQSAFVHPVASYTAQVSHPEGIFPIMSRAWKTAISQNTVAHISLPKDIGDLPTSHPVKPFPSYLDEEPEIPDRSVREALNQIEQSSQPVVLVGLGAEQAGSQVVELAEKLNAGIILSLGAKGVIPDTHPQVLGGIGSGGSQESANLLQQADLVIMIGATWYPQKYVPADTPVIQIDLHPSHISQDKELSCAIRGEAGRITALLTSQMTEKNQPSWKQKIEKAHRLHMQKISAEKQQAGSSVSPQFLIGEMEKFIAPDAIVTIDTGEHTVWFNRLFEGQKQKILFSGTWRTMGFALPAAIAAAKIYPGRQIVAFTGDGGLLMNAGELNTAVRENSQIRIVVVNNQSYALEQHKMAKEGRQPFGVALHTPDFSAWARASGMAGLRVDESSGLEAALNQVFRTDGPALLDVLCTTPVPESTMPERTAEQKKEPLEPVRL
ncbi:MAG: thiamine pyrophosphate-binding protein [Bacillaceae bacterium]|nr:thiamine pyrophosphate-binding protein [Bacillaceae bacterium]